MRFGIFILSHGRARTITTYDALRKCGYTGDMYVVIDTDDDDEPLYREKFGSEIIQFNKRDYLEKTDLGDNDDDLRIGVLARNFIQDCAKEMGYDFHLQLDDDIHGFEGRYVKDGKLRGTALRNIDAVFEAMIQFMESAPITALSFGLSAYHMGSPTSVGWKTQLMRKCMTTFLMRADDVQYFHMRMNDDITTCALNGSRGKLYFTYVPLQLSVDGTQEQAGGMTDIYQDNGTYRKSFYSVLALPSCAKISSMGIRERRLHHEISWNECVPKVLSAEWRKD